MENEEIKKKYSGVNPKSIRNLGQYKDMTDEEFEDYIARKEMDVAPSNALEKRIEKKLREFERDYDISDLKINDMLVLRALIQGLLQYEDLEQVSNRLREEGGITKDNISLIREINLMRSMLAKDISTMQEDLKITRKHRKGDKESTAMAYLEDLKTKAKKFYEKKMSYIFCPKCNTILGTIWTMYPEERKNRIRLVCNNGDCDGEIIISTKELLEYGGTNKSNIPESMK